MHLHKNYLHKNYLHKICLHKYYGGHHAAKEDYESDLDKQDQRQTEAEARYADLVMEQDHSGYGTDAPSDHGDRQEHTFRDAETTLHSPDLVRRHGCDPHKINKKQIQD